MKTLKKIVLFATVFMISGSVFTSCTNLDEELFHEVGAENFFKTGDEVMAAYMRPWVHLAQGQSPSNNRWVLQELSADCAAWPQKGRHGYDGGDWIRLHRHQWTPMEARLNTLWVDLYQGVGFVNNLLPILEELDFVALGVTISKEQAIAELKVCRAFYYWYILDLFRIAPISEKIGEINLESSTSTELFNFIEKEIKENVGGLSDDLKTTYGRVSKWGANALLARLYLNAEVYTGTPRYDECIAACDVVTTGGKFVLDAKWNDPFRTDNKNISKENIWVVAHDPVYSILMRWGQRWLHYAHQGGWKLGFGGHNGLVTQPTFYDTFANNDKRKTEGYAIGGQYARAYDAATDTYTFDTTKPLMGTEESLGSHLIFVNYIKSMTEGVESSGARSIKYEIAEQSLNYQENDWVIFRYSEIQFMKAEALMRKGGGTASQVAVDLVNSVRERSFAAGTDWDGAKYTTATLTMDEMLAERAREFAFEGFRRSDMVRFNKHVTTSWWDKTASNDARYDIYPIPEVQMNTNNKLKPNVANELF